MPLKLVRNDIINMDVDAIVNTANPKPIIGRGTDCGIYAAAGTRELLAARTEIGDMEVGQAAITPGFCLKARHIIHTVGPKYRGGNEGEADSLKRCYENSLELARTRELESVAFPLISTGSYGYPKREALQIAISTISKFLMENEMMVYLVVFDEEAFRLSEKLFDDIEAYIDQRYVEEKHKKEQGGFIFKNLIRSESVESFETYDDIEFEADIPVFAAPSKAAGLAPSEKSLSSIFDHIEEDFRERLFRLIDESGMTDAQVYKKANLDRKLFSKIRCNADYHPKKDTAIALALALELNLDETKDLLSRAGFALSPGSKFDLAVQYFIEKQIFDIATINMALFDLELPCIGD